MKSLQFGDHGESEDDDGLDGPLTPEEEATQTRRQPVEDALLAAAGEAAGRKEPDLAKCLARLHLLWELGLQHRAVTALDKLRAEVCAAVLGEPTPMEKAAEELRLLRDFEAAQRARITTPVSSIDPTTADALDDRASAAWDALTDFRRAEAADAFLLEDVEGGDR